ncbi:glutamine-hydrolyzing GMP synthase [Phocicoccus pinnipedialis]|uniref:GMP synthase [glutamine-hydrolyzing] n=1 Tax=Phocicoccus pinnipedialis TaxID=110845 RepID=A0A6V7R4G0_9BACL|nr:glutamine-hydrolyzing GMP synthase [Jeotgalicoccus pinnipedialis]MBP1939695.1 GMP synthase (glutamine-hydrolyzing) [Jeotgalicoccus pinnipedialis]CAD2072317.1 GMP synthase [glutamine-hydrolyzing] [Jeotgalicoccus pinnipedialis]
MEFREEQEFILVIDYGSQYNQLLTRRIRDLGVYSELHNPSITIDEIKAFNPKAIVLSGGPRSVYKDDAYTVDPEIFNLGIPVLGVCYGMNLIVHNTGGEVGRLEEAFSGVDTINLDSSVELFKGLNNEEEVVMSYHDDVKSIGEDYEVIATTDRNKFAAIKHKELPIYGIQFHPESKHTPKGDVFVKNFIRDIVGCKGEWTMENFIDLEIQKIKEEVGDKKVICAMSGGVDSSVTAVLLQRAIGDNLTCIFVDHGLLRKGEADMVMEEFGKGFNINIIKVDAQDRFLDKLAGVSDPEQKRKIIGNEFIEVFNDEAAKLKGIDYLAQGTIYSDIIESGTETAETIKSHHNVGGLPEDLEFKLIEPISTLFKDEVRELGLELGIPEHLVWRQPFPGPGLGIRVLGEITREKLEIVRETDWILRDEIAKAGLDRDIWQYFTVLPGIRSVGVKDDVRTFDYTIGIRAVHSVDGMSSNFAKIDWDVLETISKRLVNEAKHVNRVVYDITSKPPATIEWE